MAQVNCYAPTSSVQVHTLTTRLLNLAHETASLIETIKYGKLQFDDTEYKALEAASASLSKISVTISEEVQSLGKRRNAAVCEEGRKLLSAAEATRKDLISSRKLRNRSTFIRNIQLLFTGPKESKFDSAAVKARKKLTRERCERLRKLNSDGVILWAAAFTPSTWDPNAMQKSTFDFVLEFIEPQGRNLWPTEIHNLLIELGTEEPLENITDYRLFIDAMKRSAEKAYDQSVIHERDGQTSQGSGVPDVDEAAQGVIEMAFVVPPSKLDDLLHFHYRSETSHSAILTIPIEYRVATMIISIPRADAIRFGYQSNLPMIFNSMSSGR